MPTAEENADLATAGIAEPWIEREEGRRLHRYQDSRGIWTIGIGINLEDPFGKTLCVMAGADYDALLAGTASLTDTQCDMMYRGAALDVISWLVRLIPGYRELDPNRRIALLDMGYNLGETAFGKFERMIAAANAGNWTLASAEALDSEAARELPERYARIAGALHTGGGFE
jgi:GH24 family phage-related lysozyme (muramidase)